MESWLLRTVEFYRSFLPFYLKNYTKTKVNNCKIAKLQIIIKISMIYFLSVHVELSVGLLAFNKQLVKHFSLSKVVASWTLLHVI